MYKKGAGNDKQGKDEGNRTLFPYRNFSQAIKWRIVPGNGRPTLINKQNGRQKLLHQFFSDESFFFK